MARSHVPVVKIAAVGAAGALAPLAAGIVYSAVAIDHAVPLPPAIDAVQRRLRCAQAGEVSYYACDDGSGRPLLLVHSANAAASAYEMRPLFQRYRGRRPVYAPDLPGFGFSDRRDRTYSPSLYATALVDLLREITRGRDAADVVALSLGCEFAARAALQRPDLVRSLALISPTGLSERTGGRQAGIWLHRLQRVPLWSQAFYDLLTSRASINYFLRMSFDGEPDSGLAAYDYATAHQPGARYAPLAFVSGRLFSPDIRHAVYTRLPMPVLALYDRDAFVRFDALADILARQLNWRACRIAPSKGLPQFERLGEVTRHLDAFWQEIAVEQASTTRWPA